MMKITSFFSRMRCERIVRKWYFIGLFEPMEHKHYRNLRGKTYAVGAFLEEILHIRQNYFWTNFDLQALDSSSPFYSDNEIPKFDVYISTNTKVFIVGIEELFLLAKVNFYLRCSRLQIDNMSTWSQRGWQHDCDHYNKEHKVFSLFESTKSFWEFYKLS